MNIAIIIQGTGRYLFEVPKGIVLKQGETVKCDTVRGITDGTVFADSLNVEEPAAKLIGSLMGAKFPLKIANGACGTYAEAHPKMRQTLEAYLENEKKPKEPIKPEYYTGKVVCVNNGGYPHFWTAGKVYEVTNGAMKRNDGSSYNGKATCPEELKPNIEAVFIEFMEG